MSTDTFISELQRRLSAGFGGVLVKTNEVFDLAYLLEANQPQLNAVVLRYAPQQPLWLLSNDEPIKLAERPVSDMADVVTHLPSWQMAVASVLLGIKVASEGDGITSIEQLCLNVQERIGKSQANVNDPLSWHVHSRTIVLLQNLVNADRLRNPAILELLQRASHTARSHRVTFVLQVYDSAVGEALSSYYPSIPFMSPDTKEILSIVRPLLEEKHGPDEMQEMSDEIQQVAEACKGMTRRQVEDTAALLTGTDDAFSPETYKQVKITCAENDDLFTVMHPDEYVDELFGLDGLTSFSEALLKPVRTANLDLRPKGLLLVGPPGSGKSAAVLKLAKESGRTLCRVDFGLLRSKWVGESEARFDRALEIVESLAPAILYVDEIEKGLNGAQSSGETDGGVGSRMLGMFLSWAQDHTSDVVLAATANDLSIILDNFPEMLRAERFDAVFMFDLPELEARRQIWKFYLRKFGIKSESHSELARVSMDWTGAEIRACCRLAKLRGVSPREQLELIPQVYKVAKETVDGVRDYAVDRFVCAATGKLYKRDAASKPRKRKPRERDIN